MMVHGMFIFYIALMSTISACKNIEWLSKKWMLLRTRWFGVRDTYEYPVG